MAEQRPGELVMFTSEIECVEFNTLRDDLTIVIPADFTVLALKPEGLNGIWHVNLRRKDDG